MDRHAEIEFFSLAEEKFDFDLSLSPSSSNGDIDEEDEVFLGPVSHKERCISAGVATVARDDVSSGLSVGETPSWSPLQGHNFEEICKEAHQLAGQLEGNQQQQPAEEDTKHARVKTSQDEPTEDFVQTPGEKLDLFKKPVDVILSPLKRETFCVQDSPLKQLPPAIQKQLQKASSLGVPANSTRARLSTSSPVSTARAQPRMTLRSRPSLASGKGLPSKPVAPPASAVSVKPSKARAPPSEKVTRLAPPNKGTMGMRHSLASHRSSRAGSCDDLSDTGSVASDVSDCSLNNSLQGRRALVPPSKTCQRSLSATKALPPPTRRTVDRKNTTSSSSSMSSFNSSLSLSPTGKGKLNGSLNSGTSSTTGRGAPASAKRPANAPAPSAAATARRSSVHSRAPEPAPPTSAAAKRRSISFQARKPSETDHSKLARSTPAKRPQPEQTSPTAPTNPSKRLMERTSSLPNRSSLSAAKPLVGGKANPRPKLLVAPTPNSQLQGRRQSTVSSPDAPRIMKPKRLMSAPSDSLSQKPAMPMPTPDLLRTPSAGGNKVLQAKMRRASALPTPVNRRLSSIPTMTPKSLSRPGRPSVSLSCQPAVAKRPGSWSTPQVDGAPPREKTCPADAPFQLQPFSLEDEEVASLEVPQLETRGGTIQDMATSPVRVAQEEVQVEEEECREDGQVEDGQVGDERCEQHQPYDPQPELDADVMECHPADDGCPQTQGTKAQELNEVLLVDAPAPLLKPEEKLLIDLSNTPDLIRTAPIKPSGGQLIDLTSPLIKWSPENKKENTMNDAPLINLSF